MGYTFTIPPNSFVNGNDTIQHCLYGEIKTCLPVYAESDIAFQFVVEAQTEAEADAKCLPGESGISIGIVTDPNQIGFTHEFTDELPERFRISPLQILYNWPHGVPGMTGNIGVMECFYIRVIVDGVNFNNLGCFQRIGDPCFTSVVEYGNDENFAGFNYCNAGAVDSGGDTGTCDPEVYSFTNQDTLTIPYTASLIAKFGPVPTVQAWVYVDGVLTNVGIVAVFDSMPPSNITFSFGGPSSGIIILR